MIEPGSAQAIAVDPATLLSVSIGTLIALIVVVAGAVRSWTIVTLKLDGFGESVNEQRKLYRELRSWHLRATASAREELQDVESELEARHHVMRNRQQHAELRIARLEDRAGIPVEVAPDPTPVERPRSLRRRRSTDHPTPSPDE